MKQKKIDFVKLLKSYKSGWVAISEDFTEVLFSGRTLKEVKNKAKNAQVKVYFFPAGESYSNFIG
jgi:NADPH-dependent ferric siderophore reductase